MLNRVILIGRLTGNPELRHTTGGIAVANFRLAVNREFTNRNGEREADFVDIVVWRKQAEVVANHLSKGRLVAAEGRLQIRSYDDRQGIRRKAAEVVANTVRFLDSPNKTNGQGGAYNSSGASKGGSSQGDFNDDFSGGLPEDDFGSEISFDDSDVPF